MERPQASGSLRHCGHRYGRGLAEQTARIGARMAAANCGKVIGPDIRYAPRAIGRRENLVDCYGTILWPCSPADSIMPRDCRNQAAGSRSIERKVVS